MDDNKKERKVSRGRGYENFNGKKTAMMFKMWIEVKSGRWEIEAVQESDGVRSNDKREWRKIINQRDSIFLPCEAKRENALSVPSFRFVTRCWCCSQVPDTAALGDLNSHEKIGLPAGASAASRTNDSSYYSSFKNDLTNVGNEKMWGTISPPSLQLNKLPRQKAKQNDGKGQWK